jgi:hypothetical protein
MKVLSHLATSGFCLLLAAAATAAAPPAEDAALPQQVVTLLQARCVRCHGPEKEKARLNLASLAGLARGSRNGAVVVPGKPTDSLLWQLVRNGKMPPKQPLAESERQLLHRWIEKGSPGLSTAGTGPAGRILHWAFRPVVRPAIPRASQSERRQTDIDLFIQSALAQKQLTLNPEANRETLLRRVSFDLTGLPPTLAERETFLADTAPGAYERMVERYLASPHYGERWGKYWLEAAGYADSNGYFSADSDRPLAYRYRDYVIRSFNQGKPYDRFVREQLAGDELAGYRPDADLTPEQVELLTATHFLRNAPDGTGESDGNPDEVRIDRFTVLEGNLQVTMSCLLGLTIQCTRCHAHKFEPIRHEEYYQLQAIFYPVYCPDRWVPPNNRVVSLAPKVQREEHAHRNQTIDRQIKALKDSLEQIAGPLREQLIDERLQPLAPDQRAALKKARQTPPEKQTAAQKALLQAHAATWKVSDDDLTHRFPDFAALRESIQKALAARKKDRPPALDQLAAFVETDPSPPVHHLLRRGVHNAPGPEVQPGVPAAFCTPTNAYQVAPRPAGQVSSGRRTAFARWVTSPENPLFGRVMVNRIWQHHFGVGLVSTSANLGQSGARPSHPELLDYLASEFVRSGWSIKALHRLILTSAVYRQTSTLRVDGFQVDPDDRLLWRFPLRRLDAEAVRDAMLTIAGQLDPTLYGPYVPTHRLPEGNVEVDEHDLHARRRSVYLQQRRTQVATLLELFDAPSVVANCTYRQSSTVPLQSLALLNSHFALARAEAFAARLEREAGVDASKRITLACGLAWGREPAAAERAAAERFLAAQQQVYAPDKDGGRRAWTDLCQMVLASNAFLYVE